ncbi:MAG: hypothetical protein WCV90_09190 [Candidatus Woesearchaeota archaeon]|jgi:hypothetical protein
MRSISKYILESNFSSDYGVTLQDKNPETKEKGHYPVLDMTKDEAVKHLNNKSYREPGFLFRRFDYMQNQKTKIPEDSDTTEYLKDAYKKYKEDPKGYEIDRKADTSKGQAI